MISMMWSAISARRWRALAVGALAATIVAIAVAAPAYVDASEQAMIRNEMNNASTGELSVSALYSPDLVNGDNRQFETQAVPTIKTRYMTEVFGVDIDTMTDLLQPPVGRPVVAVPYLVFRQGYCDHIVVLAGRCAISTREVMIPQDLSSASGLTAGATMDLSWAKLDPVGGWIPAGPKMTMTVVGVYRPVDISDHYWGSQNFFTQVAGDRNVNNPVLTVRGTMMALQHTGNELQVADSYLNPSQVTPSTIPAIRAQVARMTAHDPATSSTTVATSMPALLDRIDHDRQTAQEIAAIAVVPLVLLGCLVLFLVTAYGLQDRRTEIGAVRLRGVRTASRWWLASGEVAIPALAGVMVGLFAGLLATLAAATATVPGHVSVSFGPSSRTALLYVLVAMLISVLAAHKRTLSAAVSDLLRRVPSRTGGWRAATLEIAVVALAAAAVVQLKSQADLRGITLLAPGLVIVAIAVLAGRLVPAAASRVGMAALASRPSVRGKARLGLGLGAMQLARRPGAQRLMTVHVLAIGVLTFTASAALFQAAAQREQVRVEIGADRVVKIAAAPRHALIDAVDKVDPTGKFAMLTMSVPPNVPSDPPLLAVDSSRLTTVPVWPKSTMSAARTRDLLTQAQPEPLQFSATSVELRMSATLHPGSITQYRVQIRVVPLSGAGEAVAIDLGLLRNGDHTYAGPSLVCASGCRIASIGVSTSIADNWGVTVILKQMRTLAPTADVVNLGLSDAARWKPTDVTDGPSSVLTPSSGGLQMALAGFSNGDMIGAAAVNVSGNIPVISTGPLPHTQLGLIANKPEAVNVVGMASALPRLGNHGALVDLRTYDAASGADTDVTAPEIWLNASAPRDVLARLKAAGIMVTGERNESTELSFARLQGPSIGMRFDTLVGVAAILLAILGMILMAAIDRRSRAAELRVLRVQGLPPGVARRAAFVGHAGIAVVAGLIGGVAALVAWLLVSSRLPIFANGAALVGLDLTPPWYALVFPALAGAVILAITAAFAAQDVCAVVRRNEERGSPL